VIKFYVIQIKLKKLTIDDVPIKWRAKVEEQLNNEN